MATLNTLEGIGDGVTVTTANSGGASGDAFSGVSGGANVTARTAAAMTGSRGLRCVSTGATAYVQPSNADGVASSGKWYTDAQFKCTAGTVNGRITVFEDNPGAFQGEVRTTSGARLELRDFNSVLIATTANPGDILGNTFSYVLGTGFRLGVAVLVFSATVGQLEMMLWNAAGAFIDRWRSPATLDTLRGGGAGRIRWGVAQGITRTVELDQIGTSTTDYPWVTAAQGSAGFTMDLALSGTGARASEGAAALGLDLAGSGAGARASQGAGALGMDLALAASGSTPAQGAAALGLDLALAGIGSRPSEGVAALGLDLALATAGARASQGVAALGLDLALATAGSAPVVPPAQGSAAFTMDLALATAGSAPVVPPAQGSAAFTMDLALATAGVRESAGSAAFGLDLALLTEGSDGQAGHPVPPFPYPPRPTDGYPWPPRAGESWPWTPRPVRSFEEVTP